MLKNLIVLARPHQWVKNGILLAALLFAGEAGNLYKLSYALLALLAFCFLSSVIYMFNDLHDMERDRQHPLKKDRPLASGALAPAAAIWGMTLLAAIGLYLAWQIGPTFFWTALAFLVLNISYSLWLKNIVIVDVMSVAISFDLRAYAGAVAIGVPASSWLMINTLFLALFLAFGKRRHELVLLDSAAASHRSILGKYSPYLLDQCMGVTTASVVVMYVLYTMLSPEIKQIDGNHQLYLTIPFVVYGIFRYLYLIHREERGGSPTKIMLTDWPILLTVVLWLSSVVTILYLL